MEDTLFRNADELTDEDHSTAARLDSTFSAWRRSSRRDLHSQRRATPRVRSGVNGT
jgi:hypothetical protein